MDYWYRFSSYLKRRFGCPVRKIPIDAGFTCPNRDGTKGTGGCAFCNNDAFSPPARRRASGKFLPVSEQVRLALLKSKDKKPVKFIAYFQAYSNTYAPVEVLEKRYREALIDPRIVGLSVGTRPDCVDKDVVDLLCSFAEKYEVWLELGLQTIHDDILASVNRGHDSKSFLECMKLVEGKPLKVCLHIMIGLPGDSPQRNRETALALAGLPYHGLKLHPLQVLKGTAFERLYREGKLDLISEEEYIARTCDFLELTPEDVVIQRLTADALGDSLVAPSWCEKSSSALQKLIEEEFQRRGTRQGALLAPQAGRERRESN